MGEWPEAKIERVLSQVQGFTVTDEALFRDDLGGRFAGCVRAADGL